MEQLKNQNGTILLSLGGHTIIRYENNLVKLGDLRAHETQTLQFYRSEYNNTCTQCWSCSLWKWQGCCLIMVYIPGKRLDEAWDSLDSHQKLGWMGKKGHYYTTKLRVCETQRVDIRIAMHSLAGFVQWTCLQIHASRSYKAVRSKKNIYTHHNHRYVKVQLFKNEKNVSLTP